VSTNRANGYGSAVGFYLRVASLIEALRDDYLLLANDDERLQIERALEALGSRARIVLRGIRTELKAPEVTEEQHLAWLLDGRHEART
jgi:hypothetical protein